MVVEEYYVQTTSNEQAGLVLPYALLPPFSAASVLRKSIQTTALYYPYALLPRSSATNKSTTTTAITITNTTALTMTTTQKPSGSGVCFREASARLPRGFRQNEGHRYTCKLCAFVFVFSSFVR